MPFWKYSKLIEVRMGKTGYTFLAFFAVFVWGISLVFTKTLLDNGFSPNIITFLRFLIATILAQFFLKTPRSVRIEKSDYLHFSLIALGGISLFYFFENTGLKFTSVTNTSLITATIPLFTLIVARIFHKKVLHWKNILGILSGLLGTLILFWKDLFGLSVHLKGDLLVLGSVAMWLIYSFAYRKIMHKYDPQIILKKSFQLGVLFLLPILFFEKEEFSKIILNISSISSLIFLSVFCSLLAYYLWNIAIKKVGVKRTSNLILFLPIISILSGIICFGEEFYLNILLSASLIIAGAYFASYSAPNAEF